MARSTTTHKASRPRRLQPAMPSTHGSRRPQPIVAPVALAVEGVPTTEKERLNALINERNEKIEQLEAENARLRAEAKAKNVAVQKEEETSRVDDDEEYERQSALLDNFEKDDIRVRYGDRYLVWVRFQRLNYNDEKEIRPEAV